MKSSTPDLQTLSLTVFAALASGAVIYLALAAYAAPSDFVVRVANLSDRVSQIKRLARVSPAANVYQPGSLCPSANAEALSRLSNDLQSRASALSLTMVALTISPPVPAERQVERVDLQFEVSGAYGAVTSFLTALGPQTPRIFADRVDLVDRTTKVSLRFAGHFYCSTAI